MEQPSPVCGGPVSRAAPKRCPCRTPGLSYPADMRAALASLALIVATGGASAQQHLPTVPELLTAELKASQACEGAGDPAIIREQCRLRDRLSGRLAQAGYCWGRKGQTDEKKEWHACQPDSIYEDDIEAVQR